MMKKVILAFVFVALLGSSASAAFVSWTDGAVGDWSIGANWVGGSAPVAADSPVIREGSVTVSSDVGTMSTLFGPVHDTSNLAPGASLTIANGGSLAVSGSTNVGGNSFNTTPGAVGTFES